MPFKNPPPLYSTWASMHDRCRNPNAGEWLNYGGRGIYVCDRWKDFRLFETDMGPKPEPSFTLDRIDVDGPYSPENCRWASVRTQSRNKRNAVYVQIEGVMHRALTLAERAGIKTDTVIERANAGLPLSEVLDPNRRKPPLESTLRAAAANAAAKRARTECKRGHAFTPENTYLDAVGYRHCRECHNAKMRRRSSAKRQQLDETK